MFVVVGCILVGVAGKLVVGEGGGQGWVVVGYNS